LRRLGRLRRIYGPRFFDGVTVDAWYVQGPFLHAVTKPGWAGVAVLKQEAMTLLQEARTLSQGRPPPIWNLTIRSATGTCNCGRWRI
jgi:hypothetical protein